MLALLAYLSSVVVTHASPSSHMSTIHVVFVTIIMHMHVHANTWKNAGHEKWKENLCCDREEVVNAARTLPGFVKLESGEHHLNVNSSRLTDLGQQAPCVAALSACLPSIIWIYRQALPTLENCCRHLSSTVLMTCSAQYDIYEFLDWARCCVLAIQCTCILSITRSLAPFGAFAYNLPNQSEAKLSEKPPCFMQF